MLRFDGGYFDENNWVCDYEVLKMRGIYFGFCVIVIGIGVLFGWSYRWVGYIKIDWWIGSCWSDGWGIGYYLCKVCVIFRKEVIKVVIVDIFELLGGVLVVGWVNSNM